MKRFYIIARKNSFQRKTEPSNKLAGIKQSSCCPPDTNG